MSSASFRFRWPAVLILAGLVLQSCAHQRIPIVLETDPEQSYEVIQKIEVKVEWGKLQWLWFWWHYLPWYSAVHKVHLKELVKEAQKIEADAIMNVKYLPHRQGATADAIRFKQ